MAKRERLVVAHRGASAEAPENTLSAFALAVRQGADALELDVRASADGVPVVLHDATLARTAGLPGPVHAYSATYLAAIGVPALADVLAGFRDVPILIEIKEAAVQAAVRRVLLDARATDRCVVASARARALECFRDGRIARAACGEEVTRLYWGAACGFRPDRVDYQLLSVPLRYLGLPVPTSRFLAAARALGCPVYVWTVDAPDLAQRLLARGVTGIVTNLPGVMRAAFDRARGQEMGS